MDLRVGRRVHVDGDKGTIRFIGHTAFGKKNREWVGVELDEPKGMNAGRVDGRVYFQCKPYHGIFVKRSRVQITVNARKEYVQDERDFDRFTIGGKQPKPRLPPSPAKHSQPWRITDKEPKRPEQASPPPRRSPVRQKSRSPRNTKTTTPRSQAPANSAQKHTEEEKPTHIEYTHTCGQTFLPFAIEDAGKEFFCGSCRENFVVPPSSNAPPPEPEPEPDAASNAIGTGVAVLNAVSMFKRFGQRNRQKELEAQRAKEEQRRLAEEQRLARVREASASAQAKEEGNVTDATAETTAEATIASAPADPVPYTHKCGTLYNIPLASIANEWCCTLCNENFTVTASELAPPAPSEDPAPLPSDNATLDPPFTRSRGLSASLRHRPPSVVLATLPPMDEMSEEASEAAPAGGRRLSITYQTKVGLSSRVPLAVHKVIAENNMYGGGEYFNKKSVASKNLRRACKLAGTGTFNNVEMAYQYWASGGNRESVMDDWDVNPVIFSHREGDTLWMVAQENHMDNVLLCVGPVEEVMERCAQVNQGIEGGKSADMMVDIVQAKEGIKNKMSIATQVAPVKQRPGAVFLAFARRRLERHLYPHDHFFTFEDKDGKPTFPLDRLTLLGVLHFLPFKNSKNHFQSEVKREMIYVDNKPPFPADNPPVSESGRMLREMCLACNQGRADPIEEELQMWACGQDLSKLNKRVLHREHYDGCSVYVYEDTDADGAQCAYTVILAEPILALGWCSQALVSDSTSFRDTQTNVEKSIKQAEHGIIMVGAAYRKEPYTPGVDFRKKFQEHPEQNFTWVGMISFRNLVEQHYNFDYPTVKDVFYNVHQGSPGKQIKFDTLTAEDALLEKSTEELRLACVLSNSGEGIPMELAAQSWGSGNAVKNIQDTFRNYDVVFRSHLRGCEFLVYDKKGDDEWMVLVTGPPRRILSRCNYITHNGKSVTLDDRLYDHLEGQVQTLEGNAGQLIMAFAHRHLPTTRYPHGYHFSLEKENFPTTDLTWMGLLVLDHRTHDSESPYQQVALRADNLEVTEILFNGMTKEHVKVVRTLDSQVVSYLQTSCILAESGQGDAYEHAMQEWACDSKISGVSSLYERYQVVHRSRLPEAGVSFVVYRSHHLMDHVVLAFGRGKDFLDRCTSILIDKADGGVELDDKGHLEQAKAFAKRYQDFDLTFIARTILIDVEKYPRDFHFTLSPRPTFPTTDLCLLGALQLSRR